MHLLGKHQEDSPTVWDPFCGRGTTIYAARKLGLRTYGLDSSPIATAIAQAKLASAKTTDVIALANKLVAKAPRDVPDSVFFRRAFSNQTLKEICSLREGLLKAKATSEAAILRAAALGCLHGPLPVGNGTPSYFSNQMPRTFASKPDYSVRFWRAHQLRPPKASVIDVLTKKLERITDLNDKSPSHIQNVKCLDARKAGSFGRVKGPIVTVIALPCRSVVKEMPRQVMGNCSGLYLEKSNRKLCDTVFRMARAYSYQSASRSFWTIALPGLARS